jgi:hypothetical protein
MKARIEINKFDDLTIGDRVCPQWSAVLTTGDNIDIFLRGDYSAVKQKAVDEARINGCTDLTIVNRAWATFRAPSLS